MISSTDRDYDAESLGNELRSYRYQIDEIVRDFFLRRNRDLFVEDQRVLEIGSHDGSMTQQLLGFFKHIDVLEPATTLSKVLQDKFGTRITLYTESTETFSPVQKYDAIFLVHVLEHIDDPVATLIKISSWLNADGCVFIMVPNGMAISRQLARLMGIMENELDVLPGERAQGHVRTYDLETLLRHSSDSSLSIVRSGGVLFKPLANFQLDRCLEAGIIDEAYLQALDLLALRHPDQSSSIFVVAKQ